MSDGLDGVLVIWSDYDFTDLCCENLGVFAQHLTGTGRVAPGWPDQGITLCGAPGYQRFPVAVSDGAGGAFVAWMDYRSGTNEDIYLQRVTSSGAIASDWPEDGLPICTLPGNQQAPRIASDAIVSG